MACVIAVLCLPALLLAGAGRCHAGYQLSRAWRTLQQAQKESGTLRKMLESSVSAPTSVAMCGHLLATTALAAAAALPCPVPVVAHNVYAHMTGWCKWLLCVQDREGLYSVFRQWRAIHNKTYDNSKLASAGGQAAAPRLMDGCHAGRLGRSSDNNMP